MVAVPPRPIKTAPMPKARHYDSMGTKARAELRREYEAGQQGNCYHCKYPLSQPPPLRITSLPLDLDQFPEHFFRTMVHLHHDHRTGMTLGAVHAYCNAVLWQYHGE